MRLATISRYTRLPILFGVGPVFLLLLGVGTYVRFRLAGAGIEGWLSESFRYSPVRSFGLQYGLRILIPIYITAGVMVWMVTLFPGLLAHRDWLRTWRGREALGMGLSGLLWAHLVLWWEVPTALWNLPGLRALPFWVLFPLLGCLALAFPLYWLARTPVTAWSRRIVVLGLWLLLWSALVWAPRVIPSPKPASRGGSQPCKVLILGVDGLRSDVFLEQAAAFKGIPYRNAYTPIPATRMLWHILWGGDPMTYTIGHVAPSVDEFKQIHSLSLLKEAMEQGLAPRFYIDDGGTIGIAGRHMDLDDSLMPAKGWENFVNSNLAASFPLYAIWENWFKPFPTTNPWASLDAGLKESLRLGRGSGWVMFHSCLAHQPIFLTRQELAGIHHWWTLTPHAMEPTPHIDLVTRKMLTEYDPRTNPFGIYRIRMRSILDAWLPIWNQLDQDPAYKGAVRILFSDHGERFHNVANGFQLQGAHGFDLDPWECRATMLVSGPGFSDLVDQRPRDATISLLGIRDGIHRMLMRQEDFDAAFLERCYPVAPIRYHTLETSAFGQEPHKFKAEPEKDLAVNTYIGLDGIWFTQYDKSAEERAKDCTVSWASGADLHTYKPLEAGGAMEMRYRGYQFISAVPVDEKTFRERKQYVENILSSQAIH